MTTIELNERQVVCDTYEIRICKLFTTNKLNIALCSELFVIRMRYEFVSYSQPPRCAGLSAAVVCDTYEIRICKLFTTPYRLLCLR